MYKAVLAITSAVYVLCAELYNKPSVRVIDGRDAEVGEFTYVVGLELHIKYINEEQVKNDQKGYCTGAALTANWTLTARHCLELYKAAVQTTNTTNYVIELRQVVRYGNPHSKPSENDQLSSILAVIMPRSNKDDIGLINTEPLLLKEYGKLSGIDFKALVGREATFVGYGRMRASPNADKYKGTLLLDRPLQVLDKALLISCDPQVVPGFILNMVLCAVPGCGQKQAIGRGDSGGPVLYDGTIIGVNTAISPLLYPRAGDMRRTNRANIMVITATSPYIDWIHNTITNKLYNSVH